MGFSGISLEAAVLLLDRVGEHLLAVLRRLIEVRPLPEAVIVAAVEVLLALIGTGKSSGFTE